MIQAVKGMQDILPQNSAQWQRLESLIASQAALFGYREIRTPIVEYTELFIRGVGENTDAVGKEMYTFNDKGSKPTSLALRPELTAAVARSIVEHNLLHDSPLLRLWYYGQCFRYERPQKGRYRQFYTFGAECIGTSSPFSDAEVINLAYSLLTSFGLSDFTLNVNSLGSNAEMTHYKRVLLEFLTSRKIHLSEDSQRRMETNPLRVLDSKDPLDKAALENAPQLFDCLGDESRSHFSTVQKILENQGIPYILNPLLVRGLDYYSHTVFEFRTSSLGSQDALGGGGRYNNLLEDLGSSAKQHGAGVGFGLGVERLLLLHQIEHDQQSYSVSDIAIITDEESILIGLKLATELRQNGVRVITDVMQKSFKHQFKIADKNAVNFACIIGSDERTQNIVTCKNMRTSQQVSVNENSVVEYLLNELALLTN